MNVDLKKVLSGVLEWKFGDGCRISQHLPCLKPCLTHDQRQVVPAQDKILIRESLSQRRKHVFEISLACSPQSEEPEEASTYSVSGIFLPDVCGRCSRRDFRTREGCLSTVSKFRVFIARVSQGSLSIMNHKQLLDLEVNFPPGGSCLSLLIPIE